MLRMNICGKIATFAKPRNVSSNPASNRSRSGRTLKPQQPTHILAHLQGAQTQTQSQPCKRAKILPTHNNHSSVCLFLQLVKKWLVFILLLITTAGTFVPCCHVDDCPADQLTSSQKSDDDKKEGNCSPFFACATCPGFVELSKPFQLVQPVVQLQVHHTEFNSLILSTYSAKLFQPPRIA